MVAQPLSNHIRLVGNAPKPVSRTLPHSWAVFCSNLYVVVNLEEGGGRLEMKALVPSHQGIVFLGGRKVGAVWCIWKALEDVWVMWRGGVYMAASKSYSAGSVDQIEGFCPFSGISAHFKVCFGPIFWFSSDNHPQKPWVWAKPRPEMGSAYSK